MVEGQPEAAGDVGLHLVHLRAEHVDRKPGLGGGEFRRGAVFVGGADEHHLGPARALVAGEQVCGQLAADQVPQVLDAVDVGDCGGDEVAGHGYVLWVADYLSNDRGQFQSRADSPNGRPVSPDRRPNDGG